MKTTQTIFPALNGISPSKCRFKGDEALYLAPSLGPEISIDFQKIDTEQSAMKISVHFSMEITEPTWDIKSINENGQVKEWCIVIPISRVVGPNMLMDSLKHYMVPNIDLVSVTQEEYDSWDN